MRLAHFSDIHVTVPPLSQGLGSLMNKRISGTLNYYIGGRGRHFKDVEARISRLLEDVDAQGVDHALCTGDLTQMSFREELDRCAQLFGSRLQEDTRYTVLPGNHDRYTEDAASGRWFEAFMKDIAPPEYPFVKRLGARVTLVGIDVARPTGLGDSSGRCGPEQLAKLKTILTDKALADHFVILAMHYGLFRETGLPDRKTHGIQDADELIGVLDHEDVYLSLICHGHMHNAYRVRTQKREIVCAGSATDLAGLGGYNIYTLNPDTQAFTVARRVWDVSQGRYLPGDGLHNKGVRKSVP